MKSVGIAFRSLSNEEPFLILILRTRESCTGFLSIILYQRSHLGCGA